MEVKEDRGRSQPVNQTARLSLPCCTAWSAFMETVFCVFFSEAVIRVRYNFVSRCSRVCVLVLFHQNSSFPWKLGDVVSPGIQREVPLSRLRGWGGGEGGEAHPPQWKDFSIPRITVICTYAIFEPGLQIVVTLSLICGTCPPVETDWVQRMAVEHISLKSFLWAWICLRSHSLRTVVQGPRFVFRRRQEIPFSPFVEIPPLW